jgi:hypothetical protein
VSDFSRPTSDQASTKPADRTVNGRFARGNSGGPGRPKGAVSAAAAALDQAAAEAHLELMRVVLEQARSGNLEATKMLWARIWPVRRGRPIAVDAPPIDHVDDVLPAKAAITEAVLTGQITGHEARPILKAIDSQRDQISDDQHRYLAVDLCRIALDGEAGGTK